MKAYPKYFAKDLLDEFTNDDTRVDVCRWIGFNAHDHNYVMICEVDEYSLKNEPYDYMTQPDPITIKFLCDVLEKYGECRDHNSTLPSGKQVDIIVV